MLISIIIPFYDKDHHHISNMLNYLSKLLFNKEVIFIDDRNDKSIDIRKTYNIPDEYKIINSSNSGNIGTFESRRTGTMNATGDYIWFVDVDDEPLNFNLNINKNSLIDIYLFKVTLCYPDQNESETQTSFLFKLEENEKVNTIFFTDLIPSKYFINTFVKYMLTSLCNKLLNTEILKQVFNSIPVFENFKLGEDVFILSMFLKQIFTNHKYFKIQINNQIIYKYYTIKNKYIYYKVFFDDKLIDLSKKIFDEYDIMN